jgi:hypothetical protein
MNPDKTTYDLTLWVSAKKIAYKITMDRMVTTGDNLDTLRSNLSFLFGQAEECLRQNLNDTTCASLTVRRILIEAADTLRIGDITKLGQYLSPQLYGESLIFDLQCGNEKISSRAILGITGALQLRDGKKVDGQWERLWGSYRMLCSEERVIILRRNDTLYSASLSDYLGNTQQHALNLYSFQDPRTELPVVIVNADCDMTIGSIMRVLHGIGKGERFLVQFGKYFHCSDGIADIWADTTLDSPDN